MSRAHFKPHLLFEDSPLILHWNDGCRRNLSLAVCCQDFAKWLEAQSWPPQFPASYLRWLEVVEDKVDVPAVTVPSQDFVNFLQSTKSLMMNTRCSNLSIGTCIYLKTTKKHLINKYILKLHLSRKKCSLYFCSTLGFLLELKSTKKSARSDHITMPVPPPQHRITHFFSSRVLLQPFLLRPEPSIVT